MAKPPCPDLSRRGGRLPPAVRLLLRRRVLQSGSVAGQIEDREAPWRPLAIEDLLADREWNDLAVTQAFKDGALRVADVVVAAHQQCLLRRIQDGKHARGVLPLRQARVRQVLRIPAEAVTEPGDQPRRRQGLMPQNYVGTDRQRDQTLRLLVGGAARRLTSSLCYRNATPWGI